MLQCYDKFNIVLEYIKLHYSLVLQLQLLKQQRSNLIMQKKSHKKYKPTSKLVRQTQSQREIKTLNVEKLQKYVLAIDNQFVQAELAVYQWRKSTQFPIVKIINSTILRKLQNVAHVQVVMENFPAKLGELQQIPLFKTIYLLKQALIGFQRLADKFGTFQVESDMIAIDKNNKCKVWLNSAYSMNHPFIENNKKPNQKQFLQLIIEVFAEKTLSSTANNQFFFDIKSCTTILKALKFIQQFCKANKIQVPKEFKIINNTLPKSQTSRNILFNNRGTFSHAPKIIEDLKDVNDFKPSNTFSKNDKNIAKKINDLMNSNTSSIDIIINQRKNSIQNFKQSSIGKRIEQPTQRKQTKLKKVNASAFKNFQNKAHRERDNSIKTLKKLPGLESSQQIDQIKQKNKDSIITSGIQTRTSGFSHKVQKKYSDLTKHEEKQIINSIIKEKQQKDFQVEIQRLLFSDNKIKQFPENKIKMNQNLRKNQEQKTRLPSMIVHQNAHHEEEQNFNLMNSTSTRFGQKNNVSLQIQNPFGEIDDEPEQPTLQEMAKMYQKNGWKFSNLLDSARNMKLSIHQNQRGRSPKKAQEFKMLDKIKTKKMYESILNQDQNQLKNQE